MTQTPVIVFDFDGTVALGHGPVRAFAREVARRLPLDAAERMLAEFDGALAADEAGARESTADAPLDGYDLVQRTAAAAGADESVLAEAYTASRWLLGTAEAPVAAPRGLAEFLAAAASAHRVLVTNAPAIRVRETLEAIGLGDSFDRIITSAGKPDGFARILDELAPEGTAMLSIGDIWHNDLAPARERGHRTALVGRHTPPAAAPDFRAELLEELFPALTSWLDSALAGEQASTPAPAV
ncbi:HAD family hydrolase [Microterricola viridarii]|uniref:FMN phosphatase YigB, HAD superfamily n=1 Tax=Microterricola viridarii TaxID=412690 RepID=A0A120I180_9MICO|nr:HAD family hydrolase [Microterricola viridarii]AMB59689.1 hypothetical protein AWU67_13380 [Microterricola viridarii]